MLVFKASESKTPTVHVCMEKGNHTLIAVNWAQAMATRMFENIGVPIEWHDYHRPPACALVTEQAILIRFVTRSDEKDHPGALAYSEPYGGNCIHVLYDRIFKIAPRKVQTLLAHV